MAEERMEEKQGLSRRDFVKGLVVGGSAGFIGAMGLYSYGPWRERHFAKAVPKNIDIGECKSVKILNVTETSLFDNKVLMGDIKGSGGLLVNQYTYNWPPFAEPKGELGKGSYEKGIKPIKQWLPNQLEKAWQFQMENAVHPENAGGFSCTIEVELMDGSKKRILQDVGWSYDWMDQVYRREGIDKMLANKQFEFILISHEHFDHFWGLPVAMKYNPEIPIYYPEGFYQEGQRYIQDSGHRGKAIACKPGLTQMWPGVAIYNFAIPIICRVYGENSLLFNVKDVGLVYVTGCNHQGIIQFVDTARNTIKFTKNHGIYGGLHISPFEDWDPKYDDLVIAFRKYGFEKVGCNHCTGIVCAKKFIEAGYPVVQGTARFRTKDKAYLGNGDTIEFRAA